MTRKDAELILYAGRQPGEAYVAFGGSLAFKDDPIVIVSWPHQCAPGLPLAWWHCPDWAGLMTALRRVSDEEVRTALVRGSIEQGGPAFEACRGQKQVPAAGTPENPILASARSMTTGL